MRPSVGTPVPLTGGRPGRLPGSIVSITAWNVVSRLTGFLRVLAVGAALGTTFVGNTYQSSNLVSNITFELLVAGMLSSVLVPTFVGRLMSQGHDEASRLAGALLGILLAGLGGVVVVGVLAAPWIMRLLTVAVDDPSVRDAEVRLGTFLLWFFLPQVLFYVIAAVATGLLHAAGRFAAAAAAPVLNNLVVIATMVAFWALGGGSRPTLDVPLDQRVLLAVGTSAGVAAMSLLPMVAAWRAGLRLWPRWDPRHPDLRTLGRQGAWAGGYLAATQVLIVTTLILANHVEGGVVAYQIAFTFFLLPHALCAHPIFTALYPRLSADTHAGDRAAFARRLGEGLRLMTGLLIPASLALAFVAPLVLDRVAIGALAQGGSVELIGRVLAAYAVGLVGYSAFQLLTRAAYAQGDTRSPTLINLAATAVGAVLMVVWSTHAQGGDRVVALGWSHSLAMLAAAAALLAVVSGRTREPAVPSVRVRGTA